MPPDRDLDRELRDLGSRLESPPVPDLARSVRSRLETEAGGPGSPPRLRPQLLWIAAAALVLLVAIPVFSLAVRDTGWPGSGIREATPVPTAVCDTRRNWSGRIRLAHAARRKRCGPPGDRGHLDGLPHAGLCLRLLVRGTCGRLASRVGPAGVLDLGRCVRRRGGR